MPNPSAVMQQILRAALAAVDPAEAVRAVVDVRPAGVFIDQRYYDLADIRRLFIVGAGKAGVPMTRAMVELLAPTGKPITGVVSVPHGQDATIGPVVCRGAGHPLPDEASVANATAIADLLAQTTADDVVIALLSGGGSALLTLPAPTLALEDLQATTNLLLRAGADITEINAVRKHLDLAKGGQMAVWAAPAPVVTLILSDVIGNALTTIASGPTVPDPTTFRDAALVLEHYNLWDAVPTAVLLYLHRGVQGDLVDTPKPGDTVFDSGHHVIIGDVRQACRAALAAAEQLGIAARILTTALTGEARDVGRQLGALLRDIATRGEPMAPPCCLIAGGETTVTVRGNGLGGRNQELALGAVAPLAGAPNALLASVATDGIDGPTDAAGATVDGSSARRAAALGLSVEDALAANDSHPFFDALGDLIRLGPTQTNVNDLVILLALGDATDPAPAPPPPTQSAG